MENSGQALGLSQSSLWFWVPQQSDIKALSTPIWNSLGLILHISTLICPEKIYWSIYWSKCCCSTLTSIIMSPSCFVGFQVHTQDFTFTESKYERKLADTSWSLCFSWIPEVDFGRWLHWCISLMTMFCLPSAFPNRNYGFEWITLLISSTTSCVIFLILYKKQ